MCLKWKPEPPSGPSRLAVGIRWVFKLILCDTATLLMQQMLHYLILCIKGATSPNTSCFDVCVSPSQECFCWGCPTWHHKGYLARQSRPSVWVWNFSPPGLFLVVVKEHKSRQKPSLKLPAKGRKENWHFCPIPGKDPTSNPPFSAKNVSFRFRVFLHPRPSHHTSSTETGETVRSKALANSNKTAGGWKGGGSNLGTGLK